ncbi:hypothetical protein [Clavibacter michiganensis]|nr:hypothetical protein [Clavibacter michiganensis]
MPPREPDERSDRSSRASCPRDVEKQSALADALLAVLGRREEEA